MSLSCVSARLHSTPVRGPPSFLWDHLIALVFDVYVATTWMEGAFSWLEPCLSSRTHPWTLNESSNRILNAAEFHNCQTNRNGVSGGSEGVSGFQDHWNLVRNSTSLTRNQIGWECLSKFWNLKEPYLKEPPSRRTALKNGWNGSHSVARLVKHELADPSDTPKRFTQRNFHFFRTGEYGARLRLWVVVASSWSKMFGEPPKEGTTRKNPIITQATTTTGSGCWRNGWPTKNGAQLGRRRVCLKNKNKQQRLSWTRASDEVRYQRAWSRKPNDLWRAL